LRGTRRSPAASERLPRAAAFIPSRPFDAGNWPKRRVNRGLESGSNAWASGHYPQRAAFRRHRRGMSKRAPRGRVELPGFRFHSKRFLRPFGKTSGFAKRSCRPKQHNSLKAPPKSGWTEGHGHYPNTAPSEPESGPFGEAVRFHSRTDPTERIDVRLGRILTAFVPPGPQLPNDVGLLTTFARDFAPRARSGR
jgi:hypothetical protein